MGTPALRTSCWSAMARPLALAACLGLAGCATRTAGPPSTQGEVGRAVEQPMRDLSLIREEAPDVLRRAAAAPYDLAGLDTCAALLGEIGKLDEALGPDLDGETGKAGSGVNLASELIGGVVGLPFRGVVRRITGAQQRDELLRAAVLAGMVRRGFLKGRRMALACEAPAGAS